MRKLTTIILFFHLCIFCSASEYVTNGNFEYHSGIPNDHSQLVNLNNWNSSTCVSSPYQIPGSTVILTAYNHSPDYFWVNGGYDFFLKPPHSGQGIVGMWEYEMIRQELSNPLSLHTQYIFSMYVRSASVNTLSESTLQIFLSTDEPKYGDDGSCDHGCFPTYMVTEAQKLTVINSINLSDAKFVNMNSEWVHVTFAFTPTAIDNSGTANAIYNWLGIQTILNNPSANVDPYSSCLENYILIDDVSITDMCDNICVNTMPAFSYYIFQNGTKVFDTYTDLIGVVPSTGQPSIFSTFIEDATYVYLEFFDRFSHTMYQYEAFDPTGLKDPDPSTGGFFPDFLLFWDGARTSGSACETYVTVYNALLIIKNCNRSVVIHPAATLWDPPTPCTPKSGQYNSGVSNCCVDHIDIANTNYTADERVDVNNYINIAINGPVTIQGCNVKFHAGNQINIGPNLNFINNGTAEYSIVPCGTERRRSFSDRLATSYLQSKTNRQIQIYPVPASTYCDIKSEKNISDMKLFNSLSKNIIHISNLNNNFLSLNLEDVSDGVYVLMLENKDHTIDYAKLIINK